MKLFSHWRIKIVVVIAVLLLAGTIGVSAYVGYGLTHPARETIDSNPQAANLNFEDVAFSSQKDQTLLRGWWVPAQTEPSLITPSGKTVIFVHGYTSSRLVKSAQVMPLAQRLSHAGYNVLMFDLRGAGNSDGKIVTLGQNEQYDVLAAIEFAKTEKQSEHIALLGWSMGAVTSILAGTESNDIQAIIADSPFSDLHNYITTNLPIWSGLPRYPFTPLILTITPVAFGLYPESVSPVHSLAKLNDRGLLLIHSCKDTAIPCQNSQEIYNALADKAHAELWLTQRGDHVKSYIEYGSEYEARVLGFLEKYLR